MALNTPGMVSTDSRKPLERLRRHQLQYVARKAGIPFPEGAKKSVMVPVLEANGVDPRKYLEHAPVYGRDENGMPTQEHYPVLPEHATAGKDIDYDAIIADRIKSKEEVEKEKFEESRMDALERQNRELMEKLEQVLAGKQTPEFPFKLTLAQKKKVLRERGISVKGMTREEVEAAFEEE